MVSFLSKKADQRTRDAASLGQTCKRLAALPGLLCLTDSDGDIVSS